MNAKDLVDEAKRRTYIPFTPSNPQHYELFMGFDPGSAKGSYTCILIREPDGRVSKAARVTKLRRAHWAVHGERLSRGGMFDE